MFANAAICTLNNGVPFVVIGCRCEKLNIERVTEFMNSALLNSLSSQIMLEIPCLLN